MGVFDELKSRGFIAQITNEEKVEEILNNKKVVFYIGFDPTADSLHVGHYIPIMVMAHMQRAGHKPIALFGGGTGLVGDPSGKTDMRKMLTKEQINNNISCFKKQMSNIIDFSEDKAIIVNNDDWLSKLNYIEFIREIGVKFSVNRMLAAECYKQRIERGLSFFELNYMVMQSYDFLVLNKKYNCIIQLGGDDQWSNIIGGVELIRKVSGKEAYGMTFTLLSTSSGNKMGKTEKGAVWLDPNKTTPYEFYQYWRNIEDQDVIKFLKILTFLPLEQINKLEKLEGNEINKAKEILAYEVTKIVHGEAQADNARNTASALFEAGTVTENMPSTKLSKEDFTDDQIWIVDVFKKANLATSNGEVKRLIEQGGVSVDNKKINDFKYMINLNMFDDNGYIVIKKGKKVYHKIII